MDTLLFPKFENRHNKLDCKNVSAPYFEFISGVVFFTLQWVKLLSINIDNHNENKTEFIRING